MSSPVEKGGTGEGSSERARKSPCKSAKSVSSPRKSAKSVSSPRKLAKSVSSPRKSAKSVSSPRSDQSGTTHQAEVPTKIEKSSVVKTDGEESDSSPQIKRSKLQEGAGSDLVSTVPTASAKRRAEVPTKIETSSVVKTDGEGADSSLQIKRSKLEDDAGSDLGSTVPTASAKRSESTVLEEKETDGSSSKPLESEIALQSDEPPPGKSVTPEEDGSPEVSTGSSENRAELDVVFQKPDAPPQRRASKVEGTLIEESDSVAPPDEDDSRKTAPRVDRLGPFQGGETRRRIAPVREKYETEFTCAGRQRTAASRGDSLSASAGSATANSKGMAEAGATGGSSETESGRVGFGGHVAKRLREWERSLVTGGRDSMIVKVCGKHSGVRFVSRVDVTDGQYIIYLDISRYDDESINVYLHDNNKLEVYAIQEIRIRQGIEARELHQVFPIPVHLVDIGRLTATITSDSHLFIQAPLLNRRPLDPLDSESQRTAEE